MYNVHECTVHVGKVINLVSALHPCSLYYVFITYVSNNYALYVHIYLY